MKKKKHRQDKLVWHVAQIVDADAFTMQKNYDSKQKQRDEAFEKAQTIIRMVAREAREYALKYESNPAKGASGWTEDQRDYYETGQMDAALSIAEVILDEMGS